MEVYPKIKVRSLREEEVNYGVTLHGPKATGDFIFSGKKENKPTSLELTAKVPSSLFVSTGRNEEGSEESMRPRIPRPRAVLSSFDDDQVIGTEVNAKRAYQGNQTLVAAVRVRVPMKVRQ